MFLPGQAIIRGEHASGRWDGDILRIDFQDHIWPMLTLDFPAVSIEKAEGVELDVENTGEYPITLFAYAEKENPYCWSSGLLPLKPGEREKLRILCFRDKSKGAREAYPLMLGVPGGAVAMTSEYYETPKPAIVETLRFELEGEGRPAMIAIHSFGTYGVVNPIYGEDAKQVYPMMDSYGQYRHAEWPGKVRRLSDFEKNRVAEEEAIAQQPGAPDRNKYGGWTGGPKFKATGHFYTKQVNGRWWFVDPEGCLYWAFGPAFIRPSSLAVTGGYEYLFETLAPDGDYYKANIIRKYGKNWKGAYSDIVHRRLKSWGMNTMGNASDQELCLMGRTPYATGITTLRYSARYGLGELDAAWLSKLDESTARTSEKMADDPYCIGFFIDNEIHDGPEYSRWEYYYSACREVMKKYAPNKLYLGSRQDWHRYPRGAIPVRVDPEVAPDDHDYSKMYNGYESVLRAYAKYADVLAFNQYRYTLYNLRMPDYANKPILIGETTVGALDRGMLHPSLRPTQNQDERAFACGHILESALDNPWIAGVHWFMYIDWVCTGCAFNGENMQMGIVDICDTPYPELLESLKKIGYSMYSRRFK